MRQKIQLFVFITLFLTYKALGQSIYDKEADKHIGENRSVVGYINRYKVLADSITTLIFCGTHYPEQYFTIIIVNSKKGKNKFHPSKGRSVCVHGIIIKYDGMPAIKVPNWDEISKWLFVDSIPPDDI